MKKLFASFVLLGSLFLLSGASTYVPDQAEDIQTDTTNFDNNLSSADTTVQAALETLDEVAGGAGSGDVTAVGDCATGACFNGTQGTTLTFNNAGGDATQVYDGTTMAFSKAVEFEGGNITYVDCGASISDSVTAATAGDTLVLGSCTYNVSAQISVNKSLNIIGQGPESTVISIGSAAFIVFYVTASDVTIQSLKIEGTENTNNGAINFDGEAGTVLTDGVVRNVHVIITNDPSAAGGIKFEDASGDIDGNYVSLTQTVGSSQSYGITAWANQASSSQDADMYVRMTNNISEMIELGSGTGQIRPYMFWLSQAFPTQYNLFVTVNNSVGRVKPFSTANAGVEVLQIQGPNAAYNAGVQGKLEVWVSNSHFDAGWQQTGTTPSTTNWKNARLDDYSYTHLRGVTFGLKGQIQNQNNGTIYRDGILQNYGIQGDSSPDQQADHLDGHDVINLVGQVGGAKPGTGSTTGLEGADALITLGAGGSATQATTTGTGGSGGDFVVTAGAGASQTIATSTTNVGGAGGLLELVAGDGGAANSAATTNTGGAGGDIYIRGGAGGVGTTTTGAEGDVLLAIDSGGTQKGNVGIGTLSPVSRLDVTVDGGTTAANAGKLTLSRNDTSVSSLDRIGQIDFWNNDSTLTTQNIYASIVGFADQAITTDAAAGRLVFQTTSTTAGGSPATRMTIRNDGDIGIMTTGPDKALEINSSAGTNLRLTYNDADGSATNYSDFSMSATGDLTITASGGDISLDNENLSGTGIYDLGGATLEIPNSTSLPGTCSVGQVYMDTDATTGQRIYACESANTWALQGDGGGGGGGDNITVNTTAAADANFLDGDIDWTLNAASTPDDITATVACTGCIDSTDLADTISIPTGLTIPQGVAPTADDVGEIAHDTSDNQLIVDDYVIPHKRQIHIPVGSPSAGTYLIIKAIDGMTINSINCIVDPADSTENTVIQVKECDSNGDTCADVDSGTNITCANTNTADDGTLSNPSIDAGDWVALQIVSVSGTVTQANITIDYTTVRE